MVTSLDSKVLDCDLFTVNGEKEILSKCGITEQIANNILSYVDVHKSMWNQELKANSQQSLYQRSDLTNLPFSIQYWMDGEWLVHTRTEINRGASKKALYSVNLCDQCFFARLKPCGYSLEAQTKLINESQDIEAFAGKQGVIQNHRTSYYPSHKYPGETRFEIIQDYFQGNLDILWKMKLTTEEINLVTIDLIKGLAAIHEKGFIHRDLKDANILAMIDLKTKKVQKVVICDLGEMKSVKNDYSLEELDEEQRKEVNKILGLITKLHRSQDKPSPSFISKLKWIPDDPIFTDKGMKPRPASTAQEALKEILAYYNQNHSE